MVRHTNHKETHIMSTLTTSQINQTVSKLFEKKQELQEELTEVSELLSYYLNLYHERTDTDERLNKLI